MVVGAAVDGSRWGCGASMGSWEVVGTQRKQWRDKEKKFRKWHGVITTIWRTDFLKREQKMREGEEKKTPFCFFGVGEFYLVFGKWLQLLWMIFFLIFFFGKILARNGSNSSAAFSGEGGLA